jgi:hypothetical protein
VELLTRMAKSRAFCGVLLLLMALLPLSAHADIYKCSKGGAVTYQDTPCEGANVQATHIEDRSTSYFVGCFTSEGNQRGQTIEVRANGAGTYQMIDEHNPLANGTALKPATSEELQAVSNGLHIQITEGLNRQIGQSAGVNIYVARNGYRYVSRSTPSAIAITPASLYGVYKGTNSEGEPITLLYTGGVPQVILKSDCPTY